jgi:hypothetical protein
MCTLSILPLLDRDGVRIVSNRDELRTRAPASPPSWRRARFDPSNPNPAPHSSFESTRAIWPMDIEAGGTWIAASERGLALSLLNLNPPHGSGTGRVSRGLVIPSLIAAPGVGEAIDALDRMRLAEFAPFRLVAVGVRTSERTPRVAEAAWDGRRLHVSWHALAPMCFASSGLGDDRVTPRLALYESMVIDAMPAPAHQDEFHRHRWPEHPEISVLMSRGDARTVSITTVELPLRGSERATMQYEPIDALGAPSGLPQR